MSDGTRYYDRRLLEVALQRFRAFPVVVLEGPRTVGKSTLLRAIARHLSAHIIDLDDSTVRDQVEADPGRFLEGPRPVLIDEYLRLPLLDGIKAQLNRDGSPGQFMLTGSAGRQANREGLKALVGRLTEVEVLPLSQIEVEGLAGNFVETAFGDMEDVMSWGRSRTTRREYIERVLAGGFPRVLLSETADRFQVFNSYIDQSLSYGLSAVADVRQPDDVRRLLFRYGAQTGQLLNIAGAARDIGIAPRTAENHTRLLEWLFFIHRLPAWKRTDRGPVSRPKVHVVDSGLGGRILRLTLDRVLSNDPLFQATFGNLLETFVVGEVRKAMEWLREPYQAGYWRTRQGAEVDLVIERLEDQSVIGMEVKSGSGLSSDDWRGLRRLREAIGSRFRAGMVFYTGDMPYRLDEDIYAVPIDKLWNCEPETPRRPQAMIPGIRTADGDPLSPAVRAATDQMVEKLNLGEAARWELAVVPSTNISFDDFYSSEGVRGELGRVSDESLRGDRGFGLGSGRRIEPIGQAVALIDQGRRGLLIHPHGTIVAVAAGTARFLGVPSGGPETRLEINGLAVREWALEFARFTHRILAPRGPESTWTYWSAGRLLREGRPRLHASPRGVTAVVDSPPHRGIVSAGDPEVEAFSLVASFYEWFGIPARRLPGGEQSRISAREILGA